MFKIQTRIDIAASNLHIADVHHHPAILAVTFGDGNNLVVDLIEVTVGFDAELHVFECITDYAQPLGVFDSSVVLGRFLGIEVDVTHIRVIKVVKGRHPIGLLVERAEVELLVE